MLRFLKWTALFITATVCHWGAATLFSFCGIQVNMMLVFAAAFCSVLKPQAGYPTAFLCGLFLDFFGTKLFGNNAFSFTAAACAVYALRERFDFEALLPQVVTVFVLTGGVMVLNNLLLSWFTASAMWPGFLSMLGGALVGAAFAPAVFWAVRRWLGQSETAAHN